jgi:antirestriction protein ArdC
LALQAIAKEELTAEMTAAFLSAIAGIDQATIDNNVAYIESWLKALRNDKHLSLKLLHKLTEQLIILCR